MVTTFNLKVEINGEEPFPAISGFTLLQRYDAHHRFEVKLPLQYVETSGTEELIKSKQFIGKTIKFQISETNTDGKPGDKLHEFNGVILGVALSRHCGSASDLVIKGYSPTILLDHGLNTKVFSHTSLSGLVHQLIGRYPFQGTDFVININPDPQFTFIHQQKESTYNFLCRLANRYGQWFFYNGVDTYFGHSSQGHTVQMKFGSDLSDFQLGLNLAPNKFKTTAMDGSSQLLQAPSVPVERLSELSSFAFNQSNSYFFEEQVFNTDQTVASASDVQNIAKIRRASIAAGMVMLTGISVNPRLKIGREISVEADDTENRKSTSYGNYMIIGLKHTMDGRGSYSNKFEAIPSGLEVPPPIVLHGHGEFNFFAGGNLDEDGISNNGLNG